MNAEIEAYNDSQSPEDRKICNRLATLIDKELTESESKIWHAHPVWFLEGNPIVGYSKQKAGIRLMFWSGADFDEKDLIQGTGKFKDASALYTNKDQINEASIIRWLDKSEKIQWDYKNIVKRRGLLKQISPNHLS